MKSTLKFIILFTLCYLSLQNSFQCNVAGCQYCSYPNVCGLCQTNYILTQNTASGSFSCTPVSCPINCNYCFTNNICQNCSQGYFITSTGSCSTTQNSSSILPSNCLYGTNNQTCTICSYGFTLQSGYCYPTIQLTADDAYCITKMTSTICQICTSGYIVNSIGKCVLNTLITQNNCNIANCAYCTNGNSTCATCFFGFQLTTSNTCTNNSCPIPGCVQCGSTSTTCAACSYGWVLNANKTCDVVAYGCNVQWCSVCSSSQSCGQCKPGFTLLPYTVNNITINLCKITPCPYNITNCLKCVPSYDSVFNYNKLVCAPGQCATNYMNVNGFCVPNITVVTFVCNVANCQSCSYHMFCSVCMAGYTLTREGTCQVTSCNVVNCQKCNLNNICSQCNNNFNLTLGLFYTLNPNNSLPIFAQLALQQCIPASISCNIQNCAYCKQSNVCFICATGYDFNSTSNVCTPLCNISNCLQCVEGGQNLCSVCQPSYNLVNGQCSLINSACNSGCNNGTQSCFYNWVTQKGQCTQCLSGMTLYAGSCFSTTCNINGCLLCSSWTAPGPVVCLTCQQGFIKMNGYCMIPNCNNTAVPNCANCIQNGKCIACKAGYNLQNTTGTVTCIAVNTSCVANCITCGANGLCSVCASQYMLLNGYCVCRFQNCLDCSQSALACNSCPLPLFATLQYAACTPTPNLNDNLNCNVNNCQYCLSATQCAVCAIGFNLTDSLQCSQNNCGALGLQNCQLCDQWGIECHLCQTNYTLDNFYQGGSCYLANNTNYTCNISGCAVCSVANNSICSSCLPMYYPNGTSQCLPNSCNITNCYLCLLNNVCTTCVPGYYLAVGGQTCSPFYNNIVNCQNQIKYCDVCVTGLINNSTQQYCIKCQDGFQFDSVNIACVPQTNTIPHCKVQSNQAYEYQNYQSGFFQPYCLICQQGYFINSFGLCSQYNPAANNTGCTVYNCLYCAVNSTQCSFCLIPWGISMTGQCQVNNNGTNFCPANCQLCANSTLCYTCVTTYLLNSTGVCILCNIMGCTQCQTTSSCTTCNTTANYQLINSNGTGLCLLCTVPNCQTCSGNNVCQNCTSPFVLSSSQGSCVTCDKTQSGLQNCLTCVQNNVCGVCASGYQIYSVAATSSTSASGICVQCNVTNCITCNQDNTCLTCVVGYTQISGACVQCLPPCATCTSNGSCATCITPFYFSAPNNNSCVINTIPNCLTYNPANTSICATCNQTGIVYFLNTTSNACQLNCSTNCQTCSSPTFCTQCISGFYPTTNGTCNLCSGSAGTGCSNCNANSPSTCNACFPGYYLQNSQCTICPSYCSTCQFTNNQVVCQTLAPSTTQQVLITQNSQTYLAICQQNCLTCSNVNPLVCITCAPGNYLNTANGNCIACSSSCLTCNSTNPSQCFSCYPNGFLVGTTCVSCNNAAGSNCLTCLNANSQNSCTSCPEGYSFINSSKTCVSGCPLNCQYCSGPTSTLTCTVCNSGYTLFSQNNQTLCAPCIQTCRTCADGQPGTCLTCGTGFYLSGTTCIPCSTNCNQCSAAGCQNCVSGFFLNSAGSCSSNCIIPCATCSNNNPSKCLSCIAGYMLNSQSNTCSPQSTCNGACSACPLGYTINIGKCIACTGNQCQSCTPQNPGVCTSCVPGFYLNTNNQCLSCSSSCATCLSATGCITCSIGFTTIQNIPMGPNGNQCVACAFPCATCVYSPAQCTSCVSGYQFSGWKCTQAFYFGFTITLNTTLPVFNQNYLNFIQALANSISGPNTNTVTISTIMQGSVIVSGQAAPPADSATKTASQQFNSLDSTLATNNQIAGMKIVGSSVAVVGGTIDYSEVNLALILGICIPVGVLIIAGIILYVYCKRKRSAQNIIQRIKQDSGLNVRQSFQLSANYKDSSRPFQENTSIN